MAWGEVDNPGMRGTWFDHYAFCPHRSAESRTIIWPGSKAMRRIIYYPKGVREQEWITSQEYVFLKLQGKD